MAENEKETSNVNNPISGAMAFGLGGAAVTAIGAAIRENSVPKEALTVLVGGLITGAMAGSLGCCVPDTTDAPCAIKIALEGLNYTLQLAALLAAPVMGERIMGLGTAWGQTVVDGLIGDAVILGGATTVGVVACCALGGKAVGDVIRQTLWGTSEDTAAHREAASRNEAFAVFANLVVNKV